MDPGPYRLRLTSSARRSLESIPDRYAWAVVAFVSGPLGENPYRVGKPLTLDLTGWFGARVDAYRIVYWIDEGEHAIVIERVEHRSNVYRCR